MSLPLLLGYVEVVEISPSFARKIQAVKKEGFHLGAEASERIGRCSANAPIISRDKYMLLWTDSYMFFTVPHDNNFFLLD
jgi:hypothetical protein